MFNNNNSIGLKNNFVTCFANKEVLIKFFQI